jgi:hypothetical protein
VGDEKDGAVAREAERVKCISFRAKPVVVAVVANTTLLRVSTGHADACPGLCLC